MLADGPHCYGHKLLLVEFLLIDQSIGIIVDNPECSVTCLSVIVNFIVI